MKEAFNQSEKLKICIDHHQSPENFVDHQFIDTDFSATGHILYELIKQTVLVQFNKEIANPIYAAIMTDTGSFRFERTTSDLHRVIAELLDYGVNPGEVYDKVYDNCKFSKFKLLGRTLDTIQMIGDDRIGYMTITQKDFKELGALESDTDSFVNYTLSIEKVVLGLLFIELRNGFKVSFRSKGIIPVNKLAEQFGGGGHTNAAGARFHNDNMSEKIPEILKSSEKFLKNYT
jgi:phosphoesterase RecJ-like protein